MTRSCLAGGNPRGITLVELTVSMFLAGLVMLLVWAELAAGSRYFLNSRKSLDMQQSTLVAMGWMSRELGEGDPLSLLDDTSAAQYPGIVFGSPRDAAGHVHYKSGHVTWPSLVAYYLVKNGNGVFKLMRAFDQIYANPAAAPDYAPIIASSEDTQYFATTTSSSVERRVIADDIYSFRVVNSSDGLRVGLEAADPQHQFSIYTQTLLDMKN